MKEKNGKKYQKPQFIGVEIGFSETVDGGVFTYQCNLFFCNSPWK